VFLNTADSFKILQENSSVCHYFATIKTNKGSQALII